MIRIIVQESCFAMAANVGGPVQVKCKTFDVDFPELEAFLTSEQKYAERQVLGVEVVPNGN